MAKGLASCPCSCGSNNDYAVCCGKYIDGEALPETAEQLMRSRYTAYTQCNVAYIEATTLEAALADFDHAQALQLAKSSTWLGLKVLEHRPHPKHANEAIVKFDAYFAINGKQGHIHETSKFKRIDQRWYYVDGR